MFQSFLKQHDATAWQRAIDSLLPAIHDVDRNATQIWFHFFPLELADALSGADDLAHVVQTLRLEGDFRLADQIDSSHWFLYGHRYWPHAKAAIVERADSNAAAASLELTAVVREIVGDIRRRISEDKTRSARDAPTPDDSLILGIAAIGLMTLQQVGLAAFRSDGPAEAGRHLQNDMQNELRNKTPEQIVAARRKNDSQGLAGIFRGIRAQYTVTFDERRRDARFTVINQQHLTTASANDKRDYSNETRGTVEGPIPAQCRTASCGTCWVGILGGAERLSDVDVHERKRMREFGYIDTPDSRPVIRLACQAIASGNATIVIPPWNGFIGKRKGSRETSAAPQPR
jgi:ferredoxin